jgi:hypothetical protein
MSDQAATPTTITTTQNSAPTPVSQAPVPAVEVQDLLKQTDKLKEENNKMMGEMQAKAKIEEDYKKMQARLALFEKKAAQEAEEYKKKQEPLFKEYIAGLEEATGPVDEESKKSYYSAFTNPEFKPDAERMWKQHQHMISLKASKAEETKQLTIKLQAAEEEKKKLADTMKQASASLGNMRASYAQVMASAHQAPVDQNERKEVPVTASAKLGPNEIMCAAPSTKELPFLRKFGYSNEVQISASAADDPDAPDFPSEVRPFRTTVQVAGSHGMMYDPETNERNFRYSLRNISPHTFGWMVNHSGLLKDDVSDYVTINAGKTFVEAKSDY